MRRRMGSGMARISTLCPISSFLSSYINYGNALARPALFSRSHSCGGSCFVSFNVQPDSRFASEERVGLDVDHARHALHVAGSLARQLLWHFKGHLKRRAHLEGNSRCKEDSPLRNV